MNYLKKIFFFVFLYSTTVSISLANDTFFIDFTKVLNQSVAGADAQKKLKSKFENKSVKFKKQEADIKTEESNLISQRKVISEEEYKKRLNDLRKKVSDLQNSQQSSLVNIAKSRSLAKEELIKSLNPILKKYMQENNIKIIIDKQNVVLGDTNLEITDKIIELLNKEVKSIKIN